MRCLILLLLASSLAFPATFKLFMKGGDYHMVREYQVQSDRVRYYSTERGDWEEIPKDLVDLEKTEAVRGQTETTLRDQARMEDAEEKADREQRRFISQIPMNPGVYFVENGKLRTLTAAESKIIGDKKRNLLKRVSPLPMISGKQIVQIPGEHAVFSVNEQRPEFYVRLSQAERFGIIQLTPNKGMRIVENVDVMPVTNENVEQQRKIETFQQELMTGLYKVWPEKALPAGEFAVIQFTAGELNQQVWDFSYKPGANTHP